MITYNKPLVLDTYNYENGNFCPLAVAVGLTNMPDPSHEKVFAELSSRGYSVYNTRGIAGEFYTESRHEDLMVAAQEVLDEKIN